MTLYPDRTLVFGRTREASIVFPSDAVSRLHAELRFIDGEWVLRDLNSTNGTFLMAASDTPGGDLHAERRIEGRHVVRDGQTIQLGSPESRLTFLDAAPDDSTHPSGRWSPATEALERSIEVCARHRLPVFLLGPSGSGKTFVARSIHDRAKLPGLFVLVNCGRLPHDPAQLASELLGHVKGSFTGAVGDRKGKFASADQGTLFLDEVESMPQAAQDFLLDVLEGTGSFAPYGASGEVRVTAPRFRLISASKRPLAQSGLRADLCQRLAAGELVRLPSLADRRKDIPRLVGEFLARLATDQQLAAKLTPDALAHLAQAQWPGEVRELETTVRVVVSREAARHDIDGTGTKHLMITLEAVKAYLAQRADAFGVDTASAPPRKRPDDLSETDLRRALEAHGGNKTKAAAALGIALNTLKARLRALGIA